MRRGIGHCSSHLILLCQHQHVIGTVCQRISGTYILYLYSTNTVCTFFSRKYCFSPENYKFGPIFALVGGNLVFEKGYSAYINGYLVGEMVTNNSKRKFNVQVENDLFSENEFAHHVRGVEKQII